MDLIFHSTESFEQDLQQFDDIARQKVITHLNDVAQAFIDDKKTFAKLARKPYPIEMLNGYDSSLYAVRIAPNFRAILTVDEDPLFNQVIVTLIRIVQSPFFKETYMNTAKILYQSLNGTDIQYEGTTIG